MSFRITHISDTHGMIPEIPPNSLAVIHSGDIMPNRSRGLVEEERRYQQNWLHHHRKQFRQKLGDRLFLFIRGNHDFLETTLMEQILQEAGINAHCLEDKISSHLGLSFYGFPYIPFIAGEWNFEKMAPEMSDLVSAIPEVDILVAHCPPFGLMADVQEGKGGGNTILLNFLDYQCARLPRYLLCGHFHESRGICFYGDSRMVISNAATVQHTFSLF